MLTLFPLPPSPCLALFQSLKSRGLVKAQYAWRHHYWFLTDEGIDYIR